MDTLAAVAGPVRCAQCRPCPPCFALMPPSAWRPCHVAPPVGPTARPISIMELTRKARGAEVSPSFAPIPDGPGAAATTSWGRVTPSFAPTKPGASTLRPRWQSLPPTSRWEAARSAPFDGVRLLMLVNDVSLRNLDSGRNGPQGFGFVQSKPATAFSPVAVTPDELGAAWTKGRVHLPLQAPGMDARWVCATPGRT